MKTAYHPRSAVEIVHSIGAKSTSPAAVMQECLDRIAEREPQVRAWAWLDTDRARHAATCLPPMTPALPLYGVPVGIKDIIDTADMPTAYGSALYAAHQPREDATVVSLLRAAGAVVIGKTVTTEFAYTHAGPTTNPHDRNHTPGGSSSGSAAAVADGMVPLALGTQTGGSTIRPSAYCGIVGFKPSFASVPMQGVRPLASTMDTMGLHARSVADVALLYSVLCPASANQPPEPTVLRVGLYPGPHAAEADANSHCALDAVARRVLERGMEVKPMVLPHQLFAALGEANRTILAYEGARASGDDYRRGAAQLGPATRSLIVTGQRIGDDVYQKACLLAQDCARRFADAMQDFDLLLTFSAPGRAPLATTGTGASTFNRAWTTIGVPCLTLPIPAQSPGQLPLGVQLVGTRGGDGALLAHGALIEEALKDFQSHQVHKARQAAGAAGC